MQQSTENERIEAIASHMAEIINLLGEDTAREGLVKTPVRAAKALWHLTSGYRKDTDEVINNAIFTHEGSQLIIEKDIEFFSMCEHHVLPFFGKMSVGYIPDGKIVGLSKLARIVDVFARRLQVQERLTAQVADELLKKLGAKGVIVTCTGEHMCIKMRGVQKQSPVTTTMHYNGVFATDAALRAEFFAALKNM